MEANGYIKQVDKPTEWVSSMVVAVNKDKVRICVDPKDLNQVIKREHHPMKTTDDIITQVPECKVFSVLDAKSGFLQIKLDTESSYLTTFNHPLASLDGFVYLLGSNLPRKFISILWTRCLKVLMVCLL